MSNKHIFKVMVVAQVVEGPHNEWIQTLGLTKTFANQNVCQSILAGRWTFSKNE